MITIFNRKELLATFNNKKQSDVRNFLAAQGIDYKCKVINRNSPSPVSSERGRTGTFGQDMDLAYEHIIYVKRSDYERAKHLLNI